MQELNRSKAPQTENIKTVSIPTANLETLKNGINCYFIPSNDQEIVRFDMVFEAGFWLQNQAYLAGFTNALLNAGTSTRSSNEIAEKLDFFGAYLKLELGRHTTTVSLYTLEKHILATLEILEDILKNSIFPDNEFQTLLANRKQEFVISQEKTEVIASRQFFELLYGEDHPYGSLTTLNDFKKLSTDAIYKFYTTFYVPENCKIIASGKLPNNITDIIEQHFGQKQWRQTLPNQKLIDFQPHQNIFFLPGREFFIKKNNTDQSSIRIGSLAPNQVHADYPKLKVVNTILGGYFGSRLMQNIREQKGYTYGINSMLMSARKTGSFFIATEVGAQFTKDATNEIYKEVDKLSQHLVTNDELERVKNYMLGETLRFFDGPFAIADLLKTYLAYNLPLHDFNHNIDAIVSITPEQVLQLSQKHLDTANLIEVVVGKK